MITNAQAPGGMKDLLRFGSWTQEERMIPSQHYSSVFMQTQNWLLSFTGTLLQQQGLLGLPHAGEISVKHTKGHDCSGHQVFACGAFSCMFPRVFPAAVRCGPCIAMNVRGENLILLEKRQEHLSEKTLTESVHLKISFSGFSCGKKQFAVCCILSVTW